MSKEFYCRGKWAINTSHGWKIATATKAMEDLFAACLDVTVKIRDVEIDQNFFVQDDVLDSVIHGQPFIMASRMETKVPREIGCVDLKKLETIVIVTIDHVQWNLKPILVPVRIF